VDKSVLHLPDCEPKYSLILRSLYPFSCIVSEKCIKELYYKCTGCRCYWHHRHKKNVCFYNTFDADVYHFVFWK